MNDPKTYACGFNENDCDWNKCVNATGYCIHPAKSGLDGKYCGNNKICIRNKCVDASRYKEVPSSSSESSSLTQQLKRSSKLLRNTCPQGASLEKQFRQRNLKASGFEELKYKGDCEELIADKAFQDVCNGLNDHITDIVCCERCIMHQKAQSHNNCQNNPCFNGGTCIVKSGGAFKCKCEANYYGKS